MQQIGTVTQLTRFPVLKMGGEKVDSLEVNKKGALDNGIFAFRDEAKEDYEYIWMSKHEHDRFSQYHAFFVKDSHIVKVKTPEGGIVDLHDLNLLALLIGECNHLLELKKYTGTVPLSVALVETKKEVNINIKPHYTWIPQKLLNEKIIRIGSTVRLKLFHEHDVLVSQTIVSGIIHNNDPVFLL